MTNNIKSLISKVKILKENSDYRCSDIVWHKGLRWEHSKNQVLNNPKYENTILKYFFKNNKGKDTNLYFLLHCIEKYCSNNNYPIPNNDEIVIHLRMGDVVVHHWFMNNLPYIIHIIENIIKKYTISKITIVTAFAYQAWSKESMHLYPGPAKSHDCLWTYTDIKQKKNEEVLRRLLVIMQDRINLPINIYSNENIDKDLCYCVFSKHYVPAGLPIPANVPKNFIAELAKRRVNMRHALFYAKKNFTGLMYILNKIKLSGRYKSR